MEIRRVEPQNIIKIKEVELGKPDAKDEVLYSESLEDFCKRIILPPYFNIENILLREKFYIVGNKGVGKTALLFYIHYLLKEREEAAECSMILFKSHISDAQRASMARRERIRLSNMEITSEELHYVGDFTKLWALVIYKKIIEDNKAHEIFEKDINWHSFEHLITQLDEGQSEVLKFTSTIPKEKVYYDYEQNAYVAERVQYPEDEGSYPIHCFYDAMRFADKLFCSLTLKKSKYYICIDELEAYNHNTDTYLRDLAMIRDLIITTKHINSLLRENRVSGIKIILSVRSEVINSIMREIPGLECNKYIGGFAEKINWSGTGTDFVHHPLLSIWIKRIQETLLKKGLVYGPNEIYYQLFDEFVGMDSMMQYILERTWNKPRDVIRFMNCLHDQAGENVYRYDAKSFVSCMDEYSRQSKEELIEEMSAIYSSAEIEKIFICLTAYKRHFTKEELVERIRAYVLADFPELDAKKIISDLYRIGVIGLVNFVSEKEMYGYLGQSFVENNEWRLFVHRGLWRNLELDSAVYEGILWTDIVGVTCNCHIDGRDGKYLKLSFMYCGKHLQGIIHQANLKGLKNGNLNDYIGESIQAFVVDYDSNRRVWELSCYKKKVL